MAANYSTVKDYGQSELNKLLKRNPSLVLGEEVEVTLLDHVSCKQGIFNKDSLSAVRQHCTRFVLKAQQNNAFALCHAADPINYLPNVLPRVMDGRCHFDLNKSIVALTHIRYSEDNGEFTLKAVAQAVGLPTLINDLTNNLKSGEFSFVPRTDRGDWGLISELLGFDCLPIKQSIIDYLVSINSYDFINGFPRVLEFVKASKDLNALKYLSILTARHIEIIALGARCEAGALFTTLNYGRLINVACRASSEHSVVETTVRFDHIKATGLTPLTFAVDTEAKDHMNVDHVRAMIDNYLNHPTITGANHLAP